MQFQPMHTIGYLHGMVPDINNNKFKKHILKHQKPYPAGDFKKILTRYEDTVFPNCFEFEKVLQYIQAQYYNVHKKEVYLISFWAHVHDLNMSTITHNHIESTDDSESRDRLAGTYYVQVPKNCGHFVFVYPYNRYATRSYVVEPQPCKFILFSAALEHYVTRNKSKHKRIAVSFNLGIK